MIMSECGKNLFSLSARVALSHSPVRLQDHSSGQKTSFQEFLPTNQGVKSVVCPFGDLSII